jgi:hypothetical protein
MGILGEERAGVIQWQAGQSSGELAAPGGTITITPEVEGDVPLTANWLAEDGTRLATNQVDLVCVDSRPSAVQLRIVDNPALAACLRDLGYRVNEGPIDAAADTGEIVIAGRYAHALETYIQQGGRVFFLSDLTGDDDQTVRLPVGQIVSREGTPWQGDWANSFAWVWKEGPLAHLPGETLLEMA